MFEIKILSSNEKITFEKTIINFFQHCEYFGDSHTLDEMLDVDRIAEVNRISNIPILKYQFKLDERNNIYNFLKKIIHSSDCEFSDNFISKQDLINLFEKFKSIVKVCEDLKIDCSLSESEIFKQLYSICHGKLTKELINAFSEFDHFFTRYTFNNLTKFKYASNIIFVSFYNFKNFKKIFDEIKNLKNSDFKISINFKKQKYSLYDDFNLFYDRNLKILKSFD